MIKTLEKIKKFRQKFFYGAIINEPGKGGKDTVRWSWQHLPHKKNSWETKPSVQYWPIIREMTDSDLIKHFNQKPTLSTRSVVGSIGAIGTFKENKAMWFCVDCDASSEVEEIRNKFLPVLSSYGIQHVWEFSGTEEEEKAHVWVMCACVDIGILKIFVEQLFNESKIDIKGFEVFPTRKGGNVIRLPGGIHLKTNKVNPVLWKGRTNASAEFVLDAFIEAEPITEEFIKENIKEQVRLAKETKPYHTVARKFYFNSRGLPLPVDNLPLALRKIVSNCQCINKVLDCCMDHSLMQDKKGLGHTAGLWLWSIANYSDAVHPNKRSGITEGETWIREFTEENRLTPYDSHNWDRDRSNILDNPERYFPSCEKWCDTFGFCDGCPFKDRPGFTSPRQIWYGKPIRKLMMKEVKLVSHEDSRTGTFQRLGKRVWQYLENPEEGRIKDMLVASPQGTGKSVFLSKLTVDLARANHRVLISVPTGNLAIEYRDRIEKSDDGTPTGVKAFIVMSHKNLFDKLNPGFDCPNEVNIDYLYDLGVSSSVWKKAYCKDCPLAAQCPYPNQYKDVAEKAFNVVIIQHAHLTCREVMFDLLKPGYDLMIVDEAFIDHCYKTIKPKEAEIEVLESFTHEINWVDRLGTWLKVGGYAKVDGEKFTITPSETQLENIKAKMDDALLPWQVPEYIRQYNLNLFNDKTQGLKNFYPLPSQPSVKMRVFADATPPLDYLKKVLDNEEIEVFGDDEVLDYRRMNKNNSVVQVLDASMSKTSLKGEKDEDTEDYTYARFTDILEYIGGLAMTKYKGQKILITTYADGDRDQFKTVAETFLKNNFPELDIGREPPSQVCISHMMIGTNKFSDYLIQFLVAGVYLNAKMFKHEVFKLKNITNFWNRLNDRPVEPNPFPFDIGDNASIARERKPVKRILPVNNRAGLFEYPDFTYGYPANPDFDIIERFAISKTQQALRLRFNDDRERKIYVFGNYCLPSFLITETVLEDDILGYLRNKKSVRLD